MTKPKLHESEMQSELSGSAFFRTNQRRQEPSGEAVATPERSEPDSATPIGRPTDRSADRVPARRIIRRVAFEFYQDQLETLRRYSLDEKARGDKGSMSEMVREALDAYIAKRARASK